MDSTITLTLEQARVALRVIEAWRFQRLSPESVEMVDVDALIAYLEVVGEGGDEN